MSDKKANLPAVSTFADHEVIVPPNKLKKAVEKLKPGTKVDFDPVARAEAALAELAADFSVWMAQECLRLDAARNAVKACLRDWVPDSRSPRLRKALPRLFWSLDHSCGTRSRVISRRAERWALTAAARSLTSMCCSPSSCRTEPRLLRVSAH